MHFHRNLKNCNIFYGCRWKIILRSISDSLCFRAWKNTNLKSGQFCKSRSFPPARCDMMILNPQNLTITNNTKFEYLFTFFSVLRTRQGQLSQEQSRAKCYTILLLLLLYSTYSTTLLLNSVKQKHMFSICHLILPKWIV